MERLGDFLLCAHPLERMEPDITGGTNIDAGGVGFPTELREVSC
jgi:hypothetical protein